ncbi:cation-translocating P-type ATPase [Magnetospirillum sp. UT-4]|uniref:heavy metal translocating P-type ATPase n=1 Tax=Magnetospirillum sp. UT-4 TaxID=2681467 RepID=UPI00137D62F3|nr:heavy metal translocating P-type ATPase [Magnetospirillum sp. UT-4]CAA7622792.1 Copper-transporting ATPase 1 [Magnetospirillum sp. UT-4]
MEHIVPVHVLRHRVRAVAPALRGDSERACLLEILLRKHEAVRQVRVVAAIGSVTVRFDPRRLPAGAVLTLLDRVVGNLGRATPRPMAAPPPDGPVNTVRVAVGGMTCASCAALIQMRLGRDPRVRTASVNFASETAEIVGRLDRGAVDSVVAALGYEARPMDTLAQRRLAAERDRARLAEARRRAIESGLLSLPVMALGMAMPRFWLWRWVELALTVPVVLGLGRPFFARALRLARQRSANMDTLIALGSGAALGHSTLSLLAGRHHLYFEAAAGIVSFVLLGRWLEERAKGRAGEAIRRLIALQPDTATLLCDGVATVVPVDRLAVGDLILVRPGERIALDGEVVAGLSAVDESLVTGESMPVVRGKGARVVGGCINGDGALTVRVSATGGDTVLAGIVRMVDHAQGAKLPVQRLADRVSAVFVPAVVAAAALTLAGNLAAGRRPGAAVDAAVSVLLIACPCALGLATPTAIMAAIGAAARRGIYIRDGAALEAAADLSVLIFDKTGTLTEGRPVVESLRILDGDEGEVLALLAAAEAGSEHPLGRAVLALAAARGVRPPPAEDFTAVPGSGVRARVDGRLVEIGNLPFEGEPAAAGTRAYARIDGRPAAVLAFADRPRDGAAQAIQALHDLGVRTLMVTGDAEEPARAVAAAIGIAEVVAGATPARKHDIVAELKAAGLKVGMIGDGLNDAPALAAADVGFAIGTGTDVAMDSAAITLVGGDIAKVAAMIALARRTRAIMRQNLAWALGYNTLAIPTAAMGRLTPMVASMAMAASSVSVVANSLRLQR